MAQLQAEKLIHLKKTKKASRFTAFDGFITAILVIMTFISMYPLYYTIIASLSDYMAVAAGKVRLWPVGFNLKAYQLVFQNPDIWRGYLNTILYTLFGTMFNLLLTIPTAYVMSKKQMFGHNIITWFFLITMYFSGGLIPTFMLMKALGLVNNPLIMVLSGGLSVYNMIVTRTYFSNSIPISLYEAGRIDGSSEFGLFFKIALPLSLPIIAVMTLYYAVGHWNSYFTALVYLQDPKDQPLALVLRRILIMNQNAVDEDAIAALDPKMIEDMQARANTAIVMKYSLVLIASAPMLIMYPFVQKYFVKGIMIGSVKG